jgi:hypothetical protein
MQRQHGIDIHKSVRPVGRNGKGHCLFPVRPAAIRGQGTPRVSSPPTLALSFQTSSPETLTLSPRAQPIGLWVSSIFMPCMA